MRRLEQDEDRAYAELRQRTLDAEMFDEARTRPAPKPQPTKCHACGAVAAEAVCHICKTERPALTALKNISAKAPTPFPTCRYYPNALCGCGLSGQCLEAA